MKKLNLILCLIGVLSINYSQKSEHFISEFTHCYYTNMDIETPGSLLSMKGSVSQVIDPENKTSWKKNAIVIDYAPEIEGILDKVYDSYYEIVDVIEDSLKVTFYCLGGKKGGLPLKMTYIKKEHCFVQSFTRDGKEWVYVWFKDLNDPLNSYIPEYVINLIKTSNNSLKSES